MKIFNHDNTKEELLPLENLLFETMDEIWRSRVPAAMEDGRYLLNPTSLVNMFYHVTKFFETTSAVVHKEACHLIIKMPTFLYLLANVMMKQLEGKCIVVHSTQI